MNLQLFQREKSLAKTILSEYLLRRRKFSHAARAPASAESKPASAAAVQRALFLLG